MTYTAKGKRFPTGPGRFLLEEKKNSGKKRQRKKEKEKKKKRKINRRPNIVSFFVICCDGDQALQKKISRVLSKLDQSYTYTPPDRIYRGTHADECIDEKRRSGSRVAFAKDN
jgi:hypothetical protein